MVKYCIRGYLYNMSEYYDGTKLLSMMDINGDKPELYLCTSNRTAGKTTYFSRLCVNRYIDKNEKFALLYRFNYELDACADKFFKEIGSLFFNGREMISQRRAKGIFHELFLDGVSCGYAISLNSADQIKKYSHFFADVSRILFDEFQSETGHYCNDEVKKLLSIHTSIARGGGKQYRYVPVYMLSNAVTLLNPYYVELDISERLRQDTKFLRGVGFVLEHSFNESASKAQESSAFNRAFAKNTYVAYSSQNVYLNDNKSFIEKPSGHGKYLATLKYMGCEYALREYTDLGIIYCDDKPDTTYKYKITVTTDDHEINYVMLKRNDFFLNNMKYLFERGCFRFKNMKCKSAVLKSLSY